MNLSEFKSKLYSALLDRGISSEIAEMYTGSICRFLSDTDTSGADDGVISEMADTCVDMIRKKEGAHAETDKTEAVVETETQDVASAQSEPDNISEAEPETEPEPEITSEIPVPEELPTDTPNELHSEDSDDEEAITADEVGDADKYDYAPPEVHRMSARSAALTAAITLVSSPLWVIAAALFFVPFGIMFAAEFALIGVFVTMLASGVALGCGAALTGIVYGAIRIFSSLPVGLYEIGFGVIISGVTMMFGILTYNAAVRLMPWVIHKSALLYKIAWSRVTPLLRAYLRGCERL